MNDFNLDTSSRFINNQETSLCAISQGTNFQLLIWIHEMR